MERTATAQGLAPLPEWILDEDSALERRQSRLEKLAKIRERREMLDDIAAKLDRITGMATTGKGQATPAPAHRSHGEAARSTQPTLLTLSAQKQRTLPNRTPAAPPVTRPTAASTARSTKSRVALPAPAPVPPRAPQAPPFPTTRPPPLVLRSLDILRRPPTTTASGKGGGGYRPRALVVPRGSLAMPPLDVLGHALVGPTRAMVHRAIEAELGDLYRELDRADGVYAVRDRRGVDEDDPPLPPLATGSFSAAAAAASATTKTTYDDQGAMTTGGLAAGSGGRVRFAPDLGMPDEGGETWLTEREGWGLSGTAF